jgi:hypothetical protein
MMVRQCGHSSRWLGMVFELGSCSGLSDAELIDQFTRSRDVASELAFTVLVERHGPMVLRVTETLRQPAAPRPRLSLSQGRWSRRCF